MSGDGPVVVAVPRRWQRRRAAAVVLGVVVALPLWTVRNIMSDRAFLAAAEQAATLKAYDAYINEGWLSVDQIRRERPRIAFEDARRQHSVPILRDFLAKNRNSPYATEARSAIHAEYVRALDQYRRSAPRDDRRAALAVERLLAHAEQSGASRIAVVVNGPSRAQLQAADLRARLHTSRPLDIVSLAVNLTPPRSIMLGKLLAARLGAAFAAIVPVTLLRFEAQATAAGEQEARVVVDYSCEPTGTLFDVDDRLFVATSLLVRTRLMVPGTEPLIEEVIEVPAPKTILTRPGVTGNAAVYTEMLEGAFADAVPHIAQLFVDGSSDAARAAGRPAKVQ